MTRPDGSPTHGAGSTRDEGGRGAPPRGTEGGSRVLGHPRASDERIVRCRAEELPKGNTDWDAVRALTDEQVEEAARSDPDTPPWGLEAGFEIESGWWVSWGGGTGTVYFADRDGNCMVQGDDGKLHVVAAEQLLAWSAKAPPP